jgi:hypothetical protein
MVTISATMSNVNAIHRGRRMSLSIGTTVASAERSERVLVVREAAHREEASMPEVFPDRGMDHAEKISWMIEQAGWMVEPVPPRAELDPPIPGYSYSVGLGSSYSYTEVCVFGLMPVAARGLLGLVEEVVRSGGIVPVGGVFTGLLDNDLRSAVLPLDLTEFGDLFPTARAWYDGRSFAMAQLVWPDRNGWLPWEAGFDHRLLLAQPVLGSMDELDAP